MDNKELKNEVKNEIKENKIGYGKLKVWKFLIFIVILIIAYKINWLLTLPIIIIGAIICIVTGIRGIVQQNKYKKSRGL